MADRLVSSLQYSALMRLYKKGGNKLTAAAVVEEAQRPESPLHGSFTWDDTEAARRFRLQEAGKLISSFRVETVQGGAGDRPALVRTVAVVAAKSGDAVRATSVYRKPEDMTPDERAGVLRRMQAEIDGLRRRYGYLTEFWDALDAAKQKKAS